MTLNLDYLGHKSEPREVIVERGQIRLFAKAIGETNPIHFDPIEAQASGYPDLLAPPTFGACLKFIAPAKSPTYDELGLDYRRLLHGEESIEYFKPIFAGDHLNLVTEITDIYEKKGGALEFLIRITTIADGNTESVQRIRTVSVIRNEGNE